MAVSKPYRIVVTTSDHYVWALRPLAYLLAKYWPDHPDVVVGGFKLPDFGLPENFTFVSLGTMSDYPIGRWSDALIKLLYWLPDDVFILCLDDMWPVRPVYVEAVDMAYDYCQQYRYVARFDLTNDRACARGGNVSLYGKLDHLDLVWSEPDSPYHLSLMPAFWRKEHLLSAIEPGWSPWDVEIKGTPKLAALRDKMIVVGTKACPVSVTLAMRGGDVKRLVCEAPFAINPADLAELKEAGMIPEELL